MTEKIIFQNSKGLKLVGALHIPSQKTYFVVIVAHGFTSNKDRARTVKVAEALSENGIAVFRFDFGGSGESENREIIIKEQVKDLESAILYIKERGYKKIGLLGESLGGLISLMGYNSDVSAMVLWAPVTKAKGIDIDDAAILKRKSFLIRKKDGKNFKISLEYFEERAAIDRAKILKRIKIPVLIFHSDADEELPLDDSKEAIELLPEGSILEIVHGVNHKMDERMDMIISKTVDWFEKQLNSKL